MRFETHQRRIRAAVARLNKALSDAMDDDIYVTFQPAASENNDYQYHSLLVTEWTADEPKEPKP